MNKSEREIIIIVIILAVTIIGSIVYTVWQFNLCYPEVSPDFWYCFQHAAG